MNAREFREKAERTFIVRLLRRNDNWPDGDAHPDARVEAASPEAAVAIVLDDPNWMPRQEIVANKQKIVQATALVTDYRGRVVKLTADISRRPPDGLGVVSTRR
jgi:hypothetical protein